MNDQKNIILLSIDALRADHVSYQGYGRETTPFLDSVQEEAITFFNAFSASSHTREAVPSLITGYLPHLFAANGYQLDEPSLGDRLSDNGFSTAAFHSNPYISRAYGYDSGFDKFDDDLLLGQNRYLALAQRVVNKFLLKKGNYHARAEEINKKSLNWIDNEADGLFFLWNHYMDVHGPYNPPREYDKYHDGSLSNTEAQWLYQRSINKPDKITNSERELLVDLYDSEIRYLDTHIERFLSELKHRNLLEDSIIIITSDHGDAFGEFGYFTHPREIDDILLHVPLMILHPDHPPRDIESVVSLLDIVPTILEWTNSEQVSLDGESMLTDGTISDEHLPGIAWTGVQDIEEDGGKRWFVIRDNNWKILVQRQLETNEVVQETIFRVDNVEADVVDLESIDSTRVEKLYEQLLQQSRDYVSTMDSSLDESQEIESEVSDRLEALGYK